MSGQREEDLVEARAAQLEPGKQDAGIVQPTYDGRYNRGISDGSRDELSAHLGCGMGQVPNHRDHKGQILGINRPHGQVLCPCLGLQLGRSPGGDHPTMVDDHDVIGELVGFVEILRREKHRGPARYQAADEIP